MGRKKNENTLPASTRTSKWRRDNSTAFTIKLNNETNLDINSINKYITSFMFLKISWLLVEFACSMIKIIYLLPKVTCLTQGYVIALGYHR